MIVASPSRPPITLAAGARKASLTSQGLLKILKRTGRAIRDDGRWFANLDVIEQIIVARRVLGIERKKIGG
jgi:hypothetical protein